MQMIKMHTLPSIKDSAKFKIFLAELHDVQTSLLNCIKYIKLRMDRTSIQAVIDKIRKYLCFFSATLMVQI